MYTVPASGAGAAAHQYIAQHVPNWLRVLTLRLPGRENRYTEPRLRTMGAAVEHLVQRVAAHVNAYGKPFLLFGDCAGSYLAYELGRALATYGAAPVALVVLGQRAPGEAGVRRRLHDLPSDQLRAELSAAGMVAPDVADNAALFKFFEPTLRSDLEIFDHYRWDASRLPEFPIEVIPGRLGGDTASRGWRATTRGVVQVAESTDDNTAVAKVLTRLAVSHRPDGARIED